MGPVFQFARGSNPKRRVPRLLLNPYPRAILTNAPRSEGKSAGSSVTLVILVLAAASHPAAAPGFPSSSRTTQEKSHGTFGDQGRHPTSVSRGASVQEILRRKGSVRFGLHRDRRRHRDLRSHRVGAGGPGDVRRHGCISLILPILPCGSWAKSHEPKLMECPMLDYLVIVLAFAIVCGATLFFMKVTG